MKIFLAALLFALPLPALEEGFTPLYNGRNLDGWRSVNGEGIYQAAGDHIIGTGKEVKENTFLRTEKIYRDFDFRFEMKFDDLSGNSGMMFRGLQRPGRNGRVHGYQCEHDNQRERSWTAGLYDEERRGWLVPNRDDPDESRKFTEQGKRLKKPVDWNQIRILCEGRRIRIWLNGEVRVDFTDHDDKNFTPEGFLALQIHSGKSCNVRWRNLRIKEL